MKTFTVYLDTHTGRNQVMVEAESAAVNSDMFEFRIGSETVAVFSRGKVFGYVEGQLTEHSWDEEPPELGQQ